MPHDLETLVLEEPIDTLHVRVTNGASDTFEFDPGSTLADVRRRTADILNIACNAKPQVRSAGNDEFVTQDEQYVLQEGDEVRFQKPQGEKG